MFEAFLKSSWLHRLPEDVRKIVCVSEVSDLSRLAETADMVHEVRDSADMVTIEGDKQLA